MRWQISEFDPDTQPRIVPLKAECDWLIAKLNETKTAKK
jgi:hypothetical protein